MKYIWIVLLSLSLVGCAIDSIGMTTRTDLRARAQVEIAKAQERAEIEKAKAQERAAIGVAREEAYGKEEQTRAWASVLPTIALFIMGGLICVFLVRRSERITLAQIQHRTQIHILSANPSFDELSIAAQAQGLTVQKSGEWVVLYNEVGQRIGQRKLLTNS